MKMLNTVSLVVILLLTCSVLTAENVPAEHFAYSRITWSPHKNLVTLSVNEDPGLYLADPETGWLEKVASGNGSAYQVNWSANGQYLAFKYFEKINGILYQAPAVFDVTTYRIRLLHPLTSRSGIPSWVDNEHLVFTVDHRLTYISLDGTVIAEYELPNYANQTPVSPDGSKIIFNDIDDQLFFLEFANGRTEKIRLPEGGYFEPEWSPNGEAFICSSIKGEIYVYHLTEHKYINLGSGRNAVWSKDGDSIYFSRVRSPHEGLVEGIEIISAGPEGEYISQITNALFWADHPAVSPDGRNILFSDLKNGKVYKATIKQSLDKTAAQSYEEVALKQPESLNLQLDTKVSESATVPDGVWFDIPYLNQVYDPPGWFNGFWACGGTSAVMCLGYYGLLEQWPLDVWSPYYHRADYSRYICEIYSYNDYTFQIGGKDPDGNYGYGAYGYIIQKNWENTKEHMAEYARLHGLQSSVDWYPSISKSKAQSDQKMPFVLLNSLTSSGHYISVIGYENEGTTLIVNDPYGDKNQGYYNYYGRRARYDWPGYSNGNATLKTVWCFIYFQGELPADLTATNVTCEKDTLEIGQTVVVNGQLANIGHKAAYDFNIHLAIDDKPVYGKESLVLDKINIDALIPGDTVDINRSVILPDSMYSNQYFIGYYVDADSSTGEMLEENNFNSSSLSIYGYPNIYGYAPMDSAILTNSTPTIYATYRDLMGAIDTSRIEIMVDDVNVTAASSKSLRKITYKPEEPLTEGEHHVVVTVANDKGYVKSESWSFIIETQTSVSDAAVPTVNSPYLSPNFPNPFNGRTRIRFTLPDMAYVTVEIFNLRGENIYTLASGVYGTGQHVLDWDGQNSSGASVSSGIYVLRLRSGNFIQTRRMLYLK